MVGAGSVSKFEVYKRRFEVESELRLTHNRQNEQRKLRIR